jgi:hypothetical protein
MVFTKFLVKSWPSFPNLYDLELSRRQYNKILSGYQPRQVVKWRKNQRFEDHLCPRAQGTEVPI